MRPLAPHVLFPLLTLACFVPVAAQAQDADQTIPDPDASDPQHDRPDRSIIVTGVRPTSRLDALSGVAVLQDSELHQAIRPSIGETLARTPGVSATSFGPSASRPVLRGLQGERVRVRVADTLGLLDPFQTYDLIAALRRQIHIHIEIHAHNDLGLATANTLAALRAGATHASTTVNGLGERAGNAALEEVAMAARHLYGQECGIDTVALPAISRLVARASGRPVAAGKSIVGEAVFTHESGIHVDGLLKDRANYEAFRPEEVGSAHRLVLGKHSGSHGVRDAYARLGLHPGEALVQRLLERIREHVCVAKRAPDDKDLMRFYVETAAAVANIERSA